MASAILASLFHPSEVLALVQYKLAPKTKYNYINDKARERLYHHLNMTSRSFATVIQDLDEELKDAVSYLSFNTDLRKQIRSLIRRVFSRSWIQLYPTTTATIQQN